MKTKRETNAELRARVMDDDDNIIRVKITRSGETHALTEEPRGDGGRVPWWKLVGRINGPCWRVRKRRRFV